MHCINTWLSYNQCFQTVFNSSGIRWVCKSAPDCKAISRQCLPDCKHLSRSHLSLHWITGHVLLHTKAFIQDMCVATILRCFNSRHCLRLWHTRIFLGVLSEFTSCHVPHTQWSPGGVRWSKNRPCPRVGWLMKGSSVVKQLKPGQGLACVILF